MSYIFTPIAFAIIRRLHGVGESGINRTIKNLLWALPFGILSFCIIAPHFMMVWAALLAFYCFGLCLAGISTGHGRGISITDPVTGDPEQIEFLILWTRKFLNDYWYQVLLMSVCGAASVSGLYLAFLMAGNFTSAAIVFAGGAAQGLAYIIGFKIKTVGLKCLDEPTAIGEFLSGLFVGSALAVVI